ncbi:UNVERIFIED_ORG: hypothetical protein GGE63_000968 [Rhizobium esperanzae]
MRLPLVDAVWMLGSRPSMTESEVSGRTIHRADAYANDANR